MKLSVVFLMGLSTFTLSLSTFTLLAQKKGENAVVSKAMFSRTGLEVAESPGANC